MSVLIEKTIKFVTVSTSHFDESHDINHALAVYKNSLVILETFNDISDKDRMIVLISSLVHDVCDHKYPESIKFEELEKFLKENFSDIYQDIILIINNVSWSKEHKGKRQDLGERLNLLLDIVSDADRLEAIGNEGIKRCIKYTESHGGTLPNDVIKHCYEKLLLIAPEYIKTRKGQEMAIPLHGVIVDYVKSNV